MTPNKPPKCQSSGLDAFLEQATQLPRRADSQTRRGGRMIFALDATASRQPTWDRARQLQSRMFLATEAIGGLCLQLCYYRGPNDFFASDWVQSAGQLLANMNDVQCLGGYTQIERVLDHCLATHRRQPVQAVVIVGDAVEEAETALCTQAGQLGLLGLPLFMFQEGHDPAVRQCFQQMARLSHGAYAAFDESSAELLAQLLSAAATYATGGYDALQQLHSRGAQQLLQQLRR